MQQQTKVTTCKIITDTMVMQSALMRFGYDKGEYDIFCFPRKTKKCKFCPVNLLKYANLVNNFYYIIMQLHSRVTQGMSDIFPY